MLIDLVKGRLATVARLAGRIDNGAALARLIANNQMPDVTPAAFVFPGGIDALPALNATGVHHQPVVEHVSVVIVTDYAGDGTGAGALPEAGQLRNDTIAALTGWQPTGFSDVLSLTRARLDMMGTTLIDQIDFSTATFVRV